ncbi:ferredoxin [Enterococcus sp. AZ072]|uniref:ferredoxin n=1 Tax=unclassified Enterococcus TaxID=2608891 RepID=UPI003D2CCFF8
MKCEILPERCIACGLCQALAPQFFDYTDEGIVTFIDEPHALQEFIPEKEQSEVVQSAKRCPAHAILLHNPL